MPLYLEFKAQIYKVSLEYCSKLLPVEFLQNDIVISKESSVFKTYIFLLNSYMKTLASLHKEDLKTVKRLQELRLQKILAKADSTNWWKQYFASQNIQIEKIKTLEDFRLIRPITRNDLIDTPKEALSTTKLTDPRILWRTTGGSTTGIPFVWGIDKSLLIIDVLSSFLLRLKDSGFLFKKNSLRDFHIHVNMFVPHERHAFKWFSVEDIHLHAYDSDFDARLRSLEKILRDISPAIIVTTPVELTFLLNETKKRSLTLPITHIMCVGGALPEEVRQQVEKYYSCHVFSFYGAQEVGPSAIE